jgi:predicted membrane protein
VPRPPYLGGMEQQLSTPAPIVSTSVKLVIGLFFAILGVVLTLDNLNILDPYPYLRYWPVIFIVVGALKVGDTTTRGLAITSIVAGVVLLSWSTRWLRFSIFDLWPLVLIGAGVMIVLQAVGIRRGVESQPSGTTWAGILSPRKVSVDSRDFTGGRIVAIMGGVDLDLTGAEIAQGPAIIEILIIIGGGSIRIPDGWEVVGETVPFMGGMDIKTRSKRTGRQLILRGLIVMGGLDVKDVTARNA